jgi:hypothetical protein
MSTLTDAQNGWFSMASSIAVSRLSLLAGETGVPANW